MADNKLKIGLLITQLSMGGAEKVFADHAKAFRSYYEVVEFVYTKANLNTSLLSGNVLFELDDKPLKGAAKRFAYRIKRLQQLCTAEGTEVCISHMDGANWLNVVANRKKVRTILCIHGSLTKDKGRGKGLRKFFLNRIIVPYVYSRADAIVCVSDHIKYELEQLIGKRSNVYSIPNFFDIARIEALSSEPVDPALDAILKKGEVLISVGRLAPEKNYSSLIRIVAHHRESAPNTKLFLIGEGPEEAAILQTASECGLTCYHMRDGGPPPAEAAIYLLGLMPNPHRFISKSKALLVTSFNEGFPLVLVESMICGTPVVSYDCISGPRQILAPELKQEVLEDIYYGDKGVLLPAQHAAKITTLELQRWSTALQKIATDTTYRNKIIGQAKERASHFSQEKVIAQWRALIDHGKLEIDGDAAPV